jgi:acyl dehydratase
MTDASYTVATMSHFVGRELGTSGWSVVSQERINQFADATADRQWIHVDVERARRDSPFGGCIAHGNLVLSMVSGLSLELRLLPEDAAMAFNYGLDRVRFMTPVKAGARVRCKVTLDAVTERGGGRQLVKTMNTIEIEGEAKPALTAELLTLVAPRP